MHFVEIADRADPGPAQALADARTGTRQVLELETGVDAGQIGAPPHDRGRGLVRFGRRLREPGARGDRDRDRHAVCEHRGHRRFHAGDQLLRIVARRELRRELVDGMHRGDRQHFLDGADHPPVHVDVALNPLRADHEACAALAGIAEPVSGAHAGALRHRVHRDQRCIGVRLSGDDADRTPVQRGVGRLFAGGEETVRIEVEPASSHARARKCPQERLSIGRRPKTPAQSK